MHLYAICVDCLEGVHKIVCIKCKSRWDGSWHQLGTLYTYDILAASPCCQVGQFLIKKKFCSMAKHKLQGSNLLQRTIMFMMSS